MTAAHYSLYETFKILDADDDDILSKQDFIDYLPSLGVHLDSQKAEKFLKLIDSNRDGRIDYAEFRGVFERELEIPNQPSADWRDDIFARIAEHSEALASFDQHGHINKSDFLNALL